jgi:hypothetical protein
MPMASASGAALTVFPPSTWITVILWPEIDIVNPVSALQYVSINEAQNFGKVTDPVLMIRSLVRSPLSRSCCISTSLHSIGRAGIAIEQLKDPCPLITIESGAG